MSATLDLEHAGAYPFDIPSRSYTFNPQCEALGPFDDAAIRDHALTPVLAVGSNASPSQLRRKFPLHGPVSDPIPVLYSTFRDFDSVYAARVSTYGSVPATPYPSKGTSIRLHITFLNEHQLERMNQTESLGVGYELIEMPDGCVPQLQGRRILSYVARSGALLIGGLPARLEAIPATNRVFEALGQKEAIDFAAAILGYSAADLVAAVIADRGLHSRLNEKLAHRGSKWPPHDDSINASAHKVNAL